MKHIHLFLITCLLVSVFGVFPAAGPVRAAATITVATLNDDTTTGNGCSLREAIVNANNDDPLIPTHPDCVRGSGADTIVFAGSLNGNIILSSSLPTITDVDGLTINGGTNKINVNGGSIFQVLNIAAGAPLTVYNMTLSDGASVNGGIVNNAGTLSLQNSTISGGTASGQGGAIYNSGTASIVNATLTGNTAHTGGAIYNQLGSFAITNATIVDNSVSGGSAILFNNGTAVVKNTILADGNGTAQCDGIALLAASTNNLADDVSCGGGFTFATLGQLALGSLANYGGSTSTFSLLPASVAINAGTNSACPITDQRGTGRPQGTLCDAGAFEAKISHTVNPTSIAFGSVVLGLSSTPKLVTLTNTGEANMAYGAITVTGEFAIINDFCSWQIVAPSGFCTFEVVFTPLSAVSKTGTVSIPSNLLVSPTTIALTGSGVNPTNLLKQPNFDVISGPLSWRNPMPPYKITAVLDCGTGYSYPCSIRFTGTADNRLNQIYQGIVRGGKPGARFLFGMSSKADAVPVGGTYQVVLEFYNPVSQIVASYPLNYSTGTHGWEHLSATVTLPVQFSRIAFRVKMQNLSGQAWFDNAFLIVLP